MEGGSVGTMETDDEEVNSFNCSVCCVPLTSKTRGIFKIPIGEEAKPVSDAAWADLFEGALDRTENGEQCVCRQCHRLLEEYGNIEADLSDCRRRIIERFRSARPDVKPDIDTLNYEEEKHTNGEVTESELMDLANAAFLESQELEDRLESIFHTDCSDGDLSPLTDMKDSDFDCIDELSPPAVSKSPAKKKKKRRKLGNMHCQVCRVVFADVDRQLITEHYESHRAKEADELAKFPHPCEMCGQRFSAKIKLKTHALRRHREAQSESSSPHADMVHQCPACEQFFETKKDFSRHVREHELGEESVFRCALCDLAFSTYARLARHCNDHHKDDQKCKYGCPVKFKNKNEMTEHYRNHVDERPHLCEMCSARFENTRSLKQHERTHREGRETFRCNLCDASFATRAERKQHLQTHGTCCEVCGKILSSVQTLVDHLRMHHQERKLACQVCGMLFSSQNALKAHVMRHTGGPKFQCEVCGKVFNYQTNLDAHCRAEHMVDATFKCPECPKNYGSHGSLRRHINSVHKLNRKYACNICGQTFLYSSSMLKHRRTHTGERKYPCPVCHKAFSSWDNRYSHMFIHGDKKPFECTICGQGFPRKHHILAHFSSAHPEQFKPDEAERLIKKNQPNIPGAGVEFKMQEVREEDLMDSDKFQMPVIPPGHTILVTKDDGHTYQTVDGQTFLVATTGKHDGSLDHAILLPAGSLPTTIKTEHGAELLVSQAPSGTGSTAVEIHTSSLPPGMGTSQQLVPMLVPAGEDGDLQQPQFLLIPVS